jgi:hypothetical protein
MADRLRSLETKSDWEWLSFAASLPATPFGFAGISASRQLLTGRYIVTGASVYNTATTAGTLALYDGLDTTGQLIIVESAAASASQDLPIGANGVMTSMGVFLSISTATFTGTVWAIPLDRYNITPPGT